MADVAEEYRSSLSELNFNSKPHINMLTMLAEENAAHAPIIVQAIVDHVNSVTPDIKLPSLYLVDSIVKNIGKAYISLFSKHLVSLFTSVFEKVDENIRSLLYKLRSTWTGIFPNSVLLLLDKSVVCLDPAWPILAQPQIHINPKFFKDKPSVQIDETPAPQTNLLQEVEMKKQELVLLQALHQKKKELITLQLKAALTAQNQKLESVTATVVDSKKEELKKIINSRDPRLTKKLAAASSGSESTPLQSVVVVPKGKSNKRNEKDATSPSSKKIKLDKDLKSKSNSVAREVNTKLSINNGTSNNSRKPSQTTEKSDRNKEESFTSENSDRLNSDLIKDNKLALATLKQGIESTKSISQKSSVSEESHGHIKNSFVPKTTVKEGNSYKPNPVATNEEIPRKKMQRLEPPPPPPLFLGNEDKDYRILPKKMKESKMKDSSYPKRISVPIVKSFILDKMERKVYFVNDRSFAFLDDNIPRELTFEGPPRLVFIEGMSQPMELGFGQEIKFEIDGKCNYLKLGTPSREVYINDYPYEAQFGGPPFTAMLNDGKMHRIHISGPIPQVILGEKPAYDLYEIFCQKNQEFLRRFNSEPNIRNNDISSDISVGTQDIDMRVDNRKLPSNFFNFPLEKMQDVDWQKVNIGNSQQTEWTVPKNSFETLKDGDSNLVPHNLSQGPEWNSSVPLPEMQAVPMNPPPLPPNQIINRFPSMQPQNSYSVVRPIMSVNQFPCNDIRNPASSSNVRFPNPIHAPTELQPIRPEFGVVNSSIPRLPPPPLPPFYGSASTVSCEAMTIPGSVSGAYHNTTVTTPLPMPSAPNMNVPPPQLLPRLAAPANTTVPPYTFSENVPRLSAVPAKSQTIPAVANTDMQLFMEKLKAAGLIKSNETTSSPTPVATSEPVKIEEEKEEPIKEEKIPVITFDPKCLKKFHSGVISIIYNGFQCATCGMRFKEISSEQYGRHLDWHFRRNRREKDGAKKPFSRKWFLEIKDWIQFKEFEDVDERAPSYFELQANVEQVDEIAENVCSVPCSQSDSEKCAVCSEQFSLFWIEEEEEWHLRNAVMHDEQVYHPACYEDYKKANEPTKVHLEAPVDSASNAKSDEKLDTDIKIKTEVVDTDTQEDMEVDEKCAIEKMDIDVKKEVIEMEVEVKKEVEKMECDKNTAVSISMHNKDRVSSVVHVMYKEQLAEEIKGETETSKIVTNQATVENKTLESSKKEARNTTQDKANVEIKRNTESLISKEATKIDAKETAVENKMLESSKKEARNIIEDKGNVEINQKTKSLMNKEATKIGAKETAVENKMLQSKQETESIVKEKAVKVDSNIKIENVINEEKIAAKTKDVFIENKKLEVVKNELESVSVGENAQANVECNSKIESVISKEAVIVEAGSSKMEVECIIKEEIESAETKSNEENVSFGRIDVIAKKEALSIEIESDKTKVECPVKIFEKDTNERENVNETEGGVVHIEKESSKNKVQFPAKELLEKDAENVIKEELVKFDVQPDNELSECVINETVVEIKIENDKGESDSSIAEKVDSKEIKCDSDKNQTSELNSEMSEKSSGDTSAVSDKVDEKSQSSSQTENVPVKSEDESEDTEFRPPTPDPRFQVLPPVSKGEEISNLCIIM